MGARRKKKKRREERDDDEDSGFMERNEGCVEKVGDERGELVK